MEQIFKAYKDFLESTAYSIDNILANNGDVLVTDVIKKFKLSLEEAELPTFDIMEQKFIEVVKEKYKEAKFRFSGETKDNNVQYEKDAMGSENTEKFVDNVSTSRFELEDHIKCLNYKYSSNRFQLSAFYQIDENIFNTVWPLIEKTNHDNDLFYNNKKIIRNILYCDIQSECYNNLNNCKAMCIGMVNERFQAFIVDIADNKFDNEKTLSTDVFDLGETGQEKGYQKTMKLPGVSKTLNTSVFNLNDNQTNGTNGFIK